MAKKRYIWIHMAGWLLFYIYQIFGVYFFPQSEAEQTRPFNVAVLDSSYTLSLICTFYYCYLLVFPNLVINKRMVFAFFGFILSPMIFVSIRFLLEQTFLPATFGIRNYGPETTLRYYIVDNIYRGIPVIAVSAVAWGVQLAYQKEKENKQLREEKISAELSFLKSQINPHFLFNVLNYLYALAIPLSDKLGNAIIRLSHLMRYMLGGKEDALVPLQKELDYIHNYIEIYRMLFEDRFYVNFDTKGDVDSFFIAPLLLIPFVENAFKHGIMNDPQQPVSIQLSVIDGKLCFSVHNKISNHQKDHSSGIGLFNVRRRLELIYPDHHELKVSSTNNFFDVQLQLNAVR